MTINKNSTEQINVALLDLENKIKRNNQTAAISALENDIELINKTLKEKQNGLVAGETYNINISGNADTSNHSLTADNATTADSANTATSAGHASTADTATNADTATHSDTSDYATYAGSAPIVFPEGYVYIQLNGKKNPADMNMRVPDGCAWVDISEDYASFPYIKIGSGTTQSGQVLNHTHTMKNHTHSGTTGREHSLPGYQWGNWGTAYLTDHQNNGQGISRVDGRVPFVFAYSDGYGHGHDFTTGKPSDNTTDGNNTSNTTNEVNATYAIAWEVQKI